MRPTCPDPAPQPEPAAPEPPAEGAGGGGGGGGRDTISQRPRPCSATGATCAGRSCQEGVSCSWDMLRMLCWEADLVRRGPPDMPCSGGRSGAAQAHTLPPPPSPSPPDAEQQARILPPLPPRLPNLALSWHRHVQVVLAIGLVGVEKCGSFRSSRGREPASQQVHLDCAYMPGLLGQAHGPRW